MGAVKGFGQQRTQRKQAAKALPKEYLDRQAFELMKQGQLQRAALIYEQLVDECSSNPYVYGNLAAIYSHQGQHEKIEPLLTKALELNPNYPEALNSLGNLLKRQGNLDGATQHYRSSLRIKEDDPITLYNYATCLQRQGHTEEAIKAFNQSIGIDRTKADTWFNLGIAYQSKNQWQNAADAFQEAVTLEPNNADSYYNLAITKQSQGLLQEAITAYKEAIEINPSFDSALNNLGNALKAAGHIIDAETQYRKALEIRPQFNGALRNLGLLMSQQKRFPEALEIFDSLLDSNRNDIDTLNNKGITLARAEQHDRAIDTYLKCLHKQPFNSDILNNLGLSYQAVGRIDNAVDCFRQALKNRPDCPDALCNLGAAQAELGNVQEAINHYNNCLAIDPGHGDGNNNLSIALLLSENYALGWRHYEWRDRSKDPIIAHGRGGGQKWQGSPILNEDKILIISEQGLGDTLHFMRYIPYLRNKKIDVKFCAQEKLHGLIKTSGIDENPLTPDQAKTIFDRPWIPLLSLPYALGVSPMNCVANKPYISASLDQIQSWKKQLFRGSKSQLIIGINWQGNPEAEKNNLKGRSLPLEWFSNLQVDKSHCLLSLQKGYGSEQLQACSFRNLFHRAQAEVDATWDFSETAAIISCCDLMISSDTAVAHLAAGLGVETWLLLQHTPDWRWGLSKSTSMWYPTMRLFRQKKRGDWQSVIDQVNVALKQRTKQRTASKNKNFC